MDSVTFGGSVLKVLGILLKKQRKRGLSALRDTEVNEIMFILFGILLHFKTKRYIMNLQLNKQRGACVTG